MLAMKNAVHSVLQNRHISHTDTHTHINILQNQHKSDNINDDKKKLVYWTPKQQTIIASSSTGQCTSSSSIKDAGHG